MQKAVVTIAVGMHDRGRFTFCTLCAADKRFLQLHTRPHCQLSEVAVTTVVNESLSQKEDM